MNFIGEARGYGYRRDKEEEEQEQSEEQELERIVGGGGDEDEDGEEEEEAARTTRNNIRSSTSKHQFISNLPSTSSSTTTSPHHFSYKDFLPQLSQEFTHPQPSIPNPPAGPYLVGLALGRDTTGGEGTSGMMMEEVEKEHMFDKVVTPSDVGKLNRLVIPKQHAEKYFPLDGSSNEKGFLLNFEDRNGKPWRFRYSYWNSSQSYVMTKGWSRFVKEKKLDAGDIVSFQRGAGEDSHHRLFIDWKRRPTIGTHPDFPMAHHHLDFQNVRWGNRLLYSLPPGPPPPPPFHYYNVPYAGHYNQLYAGGGAAPYYFRPAPGHLHHHHHHHDQFINVGGGGGGGGGGGDNVSPMVIDSVPVVQGRTVGKRLRLFGVNMDCPIVEEADLVGYNRPTEGLIPPPHHSFGYSSSSSPSPSPHQFPPGAGSSLQKRLPSGGGGSSSSTQSHELSKKGKSTSLSFDLYL